MYVVCYYWKRLQWSNRSNDGTSLSNSRNSRRRERKVAKPRKTRLMKALLPRKTKRRLPKRMLRSPPKHPRQLPRLKSRKLQRKRTTPNRRRLHCQNDLVMRARNLKAPSLDSDPSHSDKALYLLLGEANRLACLQSVLKTRCKTSTASSILG